MAGVSAGPDTFFRVGPAALAKPECFAVKRGDAEGRLDSHFYKPYFRTLAESLRKVGSKSLGSLVRYSEETWDKSDGRFTDVFPYIEISGVGLGTNEYDISETLVSEAPSRARQVVRADDILVSLTRPHRGAIALVLPEHDGAIASTGFAVVRDVDTIQIDRGYLWMCLSASFGCDQMLMRSSGGNYPAITRDEISKVFIPDIPLEEQRQLVAHMNVTLAERKAKLAEADALLTGLDDFVLDALGIVLPEENRRVFGVKRLGQMKEHRLDPSYYAPDLQSFLNALRIHPAVSKPLSEYVSINPQVDVSGMSEREVVGFIPMSAVSNGATGEYTFTEKPLEAVRKGYTPFKDGDILWAKITPCMQNGKSCIVEGLPNGVGFGSTEFHVLRVRNPRVSKEFCKEFLSQATLRRVAAYTFGGTAGQQRVPADFLANLPFPEISKEHQQEIVGAIEAARSQALHLRAEAESGWQEAKAWFEGQLLGDIDSDL